MHQITQRDLAGEYKTLLAAESDRPKRKRLWVVVEIEEAGSAGTHYYVEHGSDREECTGLAGAIRRYNEL